MCSMAEASSSRGLMLDQDSLDSIPANPSHAPSLAASHVPAHAHARSRHSRPTTCSLPSQTDIVVVGNGPAGILISLLLNGYEPYYHAEPSRPHPDPILHSMLAPTALEGCRPKSMLKQDFAQLTNHIQHQLAEAGRDANPISAMFDSLAHPHLDTHRGEYPSFLHWKLPPTRDVVTKQLSTTPAPHSQSPPPTPTLECSIVQRNDLPATTTARSHLVLGRGAVGGIWADMDQDHNQTLSYNEHMELPLYSFAKFLSEHAEYADQRELDRPLRSAVSAYYKAYVQQMEIQSSFSDFTTVTSVYHLKDLPGHCCCSLDPKLDSNQRRQVEEEVQEKIRLGLGPCKECSPFRYAVLGHIDAALSPPVSGQESKTATTTTIVKRRSKFLVRCKTVILATGTFDQPKKLQAVSLHPCLPLPSIDSAALTIKQTFHDTRQLEEWMKRYGPNDTHSAAILTGGNAMSPPPSPSPSPSAGIDSLSAGGPVIPEGDTVLQTAPIQAPTPPLSLSSPARPIVIVGTGLSAADAILMIQERQPWRRVIHIYKHFTASEPSPLKRCHRDVYPGYASIWLQMRKCATLKNSVQMYQKPKAMETGTTAKGQEGQLPQGQQTLPCSQIFGDIASSVHCEQCKLLQQEQLLQDETNGTERKENAPLALCSACSYRGLPDASISSWDPIAGEVVILLSHGVVIKEKVAAVGVFIGKEVHMGFLKGSLAEEMLSSPLKDAESSVGGGYVSPDLPQAMTSDPFDVKEDLKRRLGRSVSNRRGGRPRRGSADSSREMAMNMLTPPCTPPRSPILRPRKKSLWSKPCQVLQEALGNKMMDPEVHAPPSPQTQDAKAGVDKSVDCCSDKGEERDEEEETEGSSEESEEEKVEEYQVLTLLRPLVSDMYNFRIIPCTAASSASSLSGPIVDAVGLLDRQLSGVSSAAMPLNSVVAYPIKAKKCTRLPCLPIRNPDCLTNATAATKALEPTSSDCSGSISTSGSATDGDAKDEPDIGEPEESSSASNASVLRVSGNHGTASSRAISKSACLSMPCSPLLRSCRTVGPSLATPPLLTLCSTAAANALTNCLQSLTKTCRTPVSRIRDSNKAVEQDEEEAEVSGALPSASASSIGSLSRSGSVRSKRSSSISSCASSVCTLPLDESSSLTGKEEGGEEVSLTLSPATAVDTEHEELEQMGANVDVEEDHHQLRPLVAPSCTPSLYPRVDQSIYAAGAITGSKFVRYVLGNGVAIVADILRHEELEACL